MGPTAGQSDWKPSAASEASHSILVLREACNFSWPPQACGFGGNIAPLNIMQSAGTLLWHTTGQYHRLKSRFVLKVSEALLRLSGCVSECYGQGLQIRMRPGSSDGIFNAFLWAKTAHGLNVRNCCILVSCMHLVSVRYVRQDRLSDNLTPHCVHVRKLNNPQSMFPAHQPMHQKHERHQAVYSCRRCIASARKNDTKLIVLLCRKHEGRK